MWDVQRLMWFDESFLRDPLGTQTQLTIGSFLGPILLTNLIKPIIQIVFSPFLYFWSELAFWSQLFIFFTYGFTPAEEKVDEYEVTSSETD